MSDLMEIVMAEHDKEVADLQADNERLRAVLQKIAEYGNHGVVTRWAELALKGADDE